MPVSPKRPKRLVGSPCTPDSAQGDLPPIHHVSQGSGSSSHSEVTGRVDPGQGDPQHLRATRSAKLDQDGLIHVESDESEPEEDSFSVASEESGSSAETVDSSICGLHEPDAAPGSTPLTWLPFLLRMTSPRL